MNACPNCGKHNQVEVETCECGARLGTESEQRHAWETETILAANRKATSRRIAAAALSALIVAALIAFAWPTIRDRMLRSGNLTGNSTNIATTTEQNPGRSDILPPEDTIQSEEANVGAQDGVFVFSEGEQQPDVAARPIADRNGDARVTGLDTNSTTVAGNSLDAQLMADKNELQTTKKATGKDDSNCKPDSTTSTLTRPETSVVNVAQTTETQRQENGQSYILGPRGGCFYVTASGGKKYVDRSLCGALGAISARP